MTPVSCYVASDGLDFLDLFDDELLSQPRFVQLGPKVFGDCETMLFYLRPATRIPAWVGTLQEGFAQLPDLRTGSSGAVLAAKLRKGRFRGSMLAFTFGGGRFLLNPDTWKRGLGARAALNVIFEGDDGSLPVTRLQSLDSTRMESSRMHIRHQAARAAPIESFSVDTIRDVLREVVGTPVDQATWKHRIGGGDALKLCFTPSFEDLAAVCRSVLEAGLREDYARRFGWIDHIREVREPELKSRLVDQVLEDLSRRRTDGYDLVVPAIVEWELIDRFQFDFDRTHRGQEAVLRFSPRLADFLGGIRVSVLSRQYLGQKRLYALDGEGSEQYRWSIWQCLSGELVHGGSPFVLDNGVFYSVDGDYDLETRQYVDSIADSDALLPQGVEGEREDSYNRRVALASSHLLLLDKRLVHVPGQSGVEMCDLFASDGSLIHVKKQEGASSMSHLFSQGFVSASALVGQSAFRLEALQRISQAAAAKSSDTDANGVLAGFQLFDASGFVPSSHAVTFAILDKRWNGRRLSEGLSFFSRVNLRRTAEDLRRLGFPVSHLRVPLQPGIA